MYLSLLHTEENQAAPSNTHQPCIPCSKVCWVWYQSTGIGMENSAALMATFQRKTLSLIKYEKLISAVCD